jgi:hypothetical protein
MYVDSSYRRFCGLVTTAGAAAYFLRTSSTIAFAAFVTFVVLPTAPPPRALLNLLLTKLHPAISAQPPPGLSNLASAAPPLLLLLLLVGPFEAGGGGKTATAAAISRHLSCTVALKVRASFHSPCRKWPCMSCRCALHCASVTDAGSAAAAPAGSLNQPLAQTKTAVDVHVCGSCRTKMQQ